MFLGDVERNMSMPFYKVLYWNNVMSFYYIPKSAPMKLQTHLWVSVQFSGWAARYDQKLTRFMISGNDHDFYLNPVWSQQTRQEEKVCLCSSTVTNCCFLQFG